VSVPAQQITEGASSIATAGVIRPSVGVTGGCESVVESRNDTATRPSADAVTFSAAIGNLGPGDAANAVVRFLVDGAQVGGELTVASLAAGASTAVSSDAWTATPGAHTVEAVVDPDNAIAEIDDATTRRRPASLCRRRRI
jgi:subtilase family serine protease